jgi:CheY-like chemotaxis protein
MQTVLVQTVLVVDDEFGIVGVLETVLGDEGYRVLTACNGKQGLARLAEEKPEVVLLEFMMPILSGCQILQAMALEPAYQRIPVIMMSSLSERVVAERCRGYAGFLHKPFSVAAVLHEMIGVASTRATASAEAAPEQRQRIGEQIRGAEKVAPHADWPAHRRACISEL